MSQDRLTQSLSSGGPHHRLAQLVGEWEGTARLWFEPDKLADESPITGTIRAALDGRFVIHKYRGSTLGKPVAGLAIHGYHLDRDRFETAWIDSFHNGTTIMLSVGSPGTAASELSVLGQYADPSGGPPWGWRTRIEQPDPDHLVITHYNITPAGEEAKAVEIQYARKR